MSETKEHVSPQGTAIPTLATLPAVIPVASPEPTHSHPRRRILLLLVLLAAAAGAAYWKMHPEEVLPPGIVSSNGRLEADSVDIATKIAGRIASLQADQGDVVKAGQVLAVMDMRDLQAQFRQAEALAVQAQRTLDQARANRAQQLAIVELAQRELGRTTYLVPKGFATMQTLDQQTKQLQGAQASLQSMEAAIGVAESAAEAATHQVEYYAAQIADGVLRAPKNGPIEYRVANVGEVLPAGGKVLTMLDASYVYMDVYLPTAEAGRVKLGAEARIVLDAASNHVIPAQVVYVASQAQFTPKQVETRSERDKLMFRVRARIDPARLSGREALVRTGLPGVTYVRVDDATAWPPRLAPSPPPRPADAER